MSLLHEAAEEGNLFGVWTALGGARTAARPKLWMFPAGAPHEPTAPEPIVQVVVKKTPAKMAEDAAARAAAQALLDARTPAVNSREGWGCSALVLAAQHTEAPPVRDEMEEIEEAEAGIVPPLPAGWVRTSDELPPVELLPLLEEEKVEIEAAVENAVAHFYEDVDETKEVEVNVAKKHEAAAAMRAAVAARAAVHGACAAATAADAAIAAIEYEDFYKHEATGLRLPLSEPPQHPHFEIARHLLARGADPGARDYDGATALLWACRRGDHLLAQMLLQHPAADLMLPLVKTHDGKADPMSEAHRFNHEEVVSVLFPFHRKATKERHEVVRLAARKKEAEAAAAKYEEKKAKKRAAKQAKARALGAAPPPAIMDEKHKA